MISDSLGFKLPRSKGVWNGKDDHFYTVTPSLVVLENGCINSWTIHPPPLFVVQSQGITISNYSKELTSGCTKRFFNCPWIEWSYIFCNLLILHGILAFCAMDKQYETEQALRIRHMYQCEPLSKTYLALKKRDCWWDPSFSCQIFRRILSFLSLLFSWLTDEHE